jgi:hypothetical protein
MKRIVVTVMNLVAAQRTIKGTLNIGSYRSLVMLIVLITTSVIAHSQSATVSIDCAVDKGVLFRAEAYNNVSGVNTGAATRDADYAFMNSQGLHSKILRVWISDGIYTPATDTYNYGSYNSYLNSVSQLMADEILVCIPGNVMVDTWHYTPDQCKPILKNIIKYFKTNYPKIRYIEGLNEPDNYGGTLMTSTNCYSYYRAFYQAVNEVNAELNPAIPLLVGGPTITSFKYSGDEWITKFLDGYKNDTDPTKKLDFLSFHTYSYKAAPRQIDPIRGKIEGWLINRGLPTTIPSFITEVGLFPGADVSGTEEDDALRQAAGMASYNYWMTNSIYNVPFQWVMRHAAEVRKDQMVTRPKSYSDRLTPYGNMMKMMGMMKTQRIQATTNVMDANGLGVYAMAASDATGISFMAWNYQHTGTANYYTSVKLNSLPAIFTGMGIRKKVYRIDESTSNNYYGVSNCNLQLVSDTVLANTGASLTLSLGIINHNTLQLVVLEPTALPAANTFGLSVARQGNSALLKWSTNTENNSVYFEILRSTDGTAFTVIDRKDAAGNSSTSKAYSTIDSTPIPGINYYQVRQVNTDSSRIASGIVSIFMNLVETTTSIYYNFGNTGSENGNPTSGVPAGWIASAVSIGNATSPTSFFTSTSASNTYAGNSQEGNATMSTRQGSLTGKSVTYSGVTTNIPATPFSTLSYFQVTLTPAATEHVKIENISFGSRSLGATGGPANLIIRTSLDGFATNVFAKDVAANTAWTLVNAPFATPLTGAAGAPVTIRIYGNDAIGSTSNNWRIDDLNIVTTLAITLPQINTINVEETADSKVLLTWQTSSEQNIANFEVLRSGDGNTFTSIGQVAAVGNSAVPTQYSFIDQAPLSGINYYQVKQLSNTAGATLSNVVSIYRSAWTTKNIYYNFGATGFENGDPTSGVPDEWTVTDVTAGNTSRTDNFFTSISNTGTYVGNSKEGNITSIAKQGSLTGRTLTYGTVTTTISATPVTALSYFEVSLTAPANQLVSIEKISFGNRSIGSSGGPANVVIRTSADNFSTNVFSQNINTNSVWELLEATFTTRITGTELQPVIIRIYANDAVGGTVNNWRIDDLNITVVYTPAVTLPVTLTSFSAAAQHNGVQLKWKTVSEENNARFEILRSGNARDFIKIGTIAGTLHSSTAKNYAYLDTDPLQGTSYYSLQQVDVDGKVKLYGPLMVKNPFSATALKVFATNDFVSIAFNASKASQAKLSLVDVNGRILLTKELLLVNGINKIDLPVSLTTGSYFISISGSEFSAVKKFVK